MRIRYITFGNAEWLSVICYRSISFEISARNKGKQICFCYFFHNCSERYWELKNKKNYYRFSTVCNTLIGLTESMHIRVYKQLKRQTKYGMRENTIRRTMKSHKLRACLTFTHRATSRFFEIYVMNYWLLGLPFYVYYILLLMPVEKLISVRHAEYLLFTKFRVNLLLPCKQTVNPNAQIVFHFFRLFFFISRRNSYGYYIFYAYCTTVRAKMRKPNTKLRLRGILRKTNGGYYVYSLSRRFDCVTGNVYVVYSTVCLARTLFKTSKII